MFCSLRQHESDPGTGGVSLYTRTVLSVARIDIVQ